MSELNRLIAESLGYKAKHFKGIADHWILENDNGERPTAFQSSSPTEARMWEEQCPDYEHDLNEAWPLLLDMPPEDVNRLLWHLDKNPEIAAGEIALEWSQYKGIIIPTPPSLQS